MPGTDEIGEGSKQAWSAAYDLLDDFVDHHGFWEEKFMGSFFKGFDYIQDGLEEGVMKIDDDFRDTMAANEEVSQAWGRHLQKALNWMGFGLKAVGRVGRTVVEGAFGAVYSVVTPAGHIAYRAIAAPTTAVVEGTLWPTMLYTWNGIAWITHQHKDEPTGDVDSLTVTFVPERVSSTRVVVKEEAAAVVQAPVDDAAHQEVVDGEQNAAGNVEEPEITVVRVSEV